MPLERKSVPPASRTMLPAYVVLSLIVALAYSFDPGSRLALAPAYTFQREVLPLPVWGAVMFWLALIMLIAFATKSTILFAYALCCGVVVWLIWGGAIAASIFITPNTSILAPVLPWFVAVCHVASTRTLLSKEEV